MWEKIEQIQEFLKEQKVDGWLLYDNHGSNPFVRELLDIPSHMVLTRRFFYWIPKEGSPVKILHKIEANSLEALPGKSQIYLSWLDLEHLLKKILKEPNKIYMEYSPRNSNPYVSTVDAGTMEVIRDCQVSVGSSADLLQMFTSVLSPEQMASHLEAAAVVEKTAERAFELISDRIRQDKPITEYEVQKFILSEFTAQNCITEEGPSCSVNEHTALPHYMARKHTTSEIRRGDYILLDLWCKKAVSNGVYADITRVAVVSSEPTPRQEEIFGIVKSAQKAAIDLIRDRMEQKAKLRGSEVDDACRKVIKEKGYGEFFTHRTGHNIDSSVHGGGAHLDNLETADHRRVLPGMCFSVEPGIYLPGEFGVRLEYNLMIHHDRSVEITGGTEENIICLI